jgi:hypothetical protein
MKMFRIQIQKSGKFVSNYLISCLGGIVGMYSGSKISDIIYDRKK